MERVEAKLIAWKQLYEEFGRVQAQVAVAIDARDFESAENLKDQMARLAMRSDAALHAIYEALAVRNSATSHLRSPAAQATQDHARR
jgi:RNase adaptor protein for sRNA GlmZ degradation